MKPIALSGNETSFFGFADLPAEVFAAAPTRIAALLDAAVAQLDLDALYREVSPARVGAVLGTSNSTMEEFTDNPVRTDMAYPALRLKERWGVDGPAWCVSTACSSSAKAFASARRLLHEGICDAVLVGGVDAHTRTVIEGFHALESLAPGRTRPLAADRDGINLGEGAAVFVMRRTADVPDARVHLLGVGESSDAYHLTAPDPEGRGAEAAMRAALDDAGLTPGDISFINLHGTGTVYNDAMECAAVRRVFGTRVCYSSTKPLTGHCLGAAGAIEAALCYLALCEREAPCRAISNSFAFGGSNASVILGRSSASKPMVPLHDLLPHAEPMVLLSGYEPPVDDDTVSAYVDVTPASPFYERALGGVPACVALEYLAQTMALLVGLTRRRKGLPPHVGFVLGSRKLETTIPCFAAGCRYHMTATCTYQDETFGSFDCRATDAMGAVVAKGTLTAFQPDGEVTPERIAEFA